MSEITRSALFGKLNALAYKAIEGAAVFCKLRGNPYVELVHWIQQILHLPDSDLHRIVRRFELDASALAKDITDALDRLPRGATSIMDLSAQVENAVERGWVYSTLMFGVANIRTGALLVGILKTPSLRGHLLTISPQFAAIKEGAMTDDFWSICTGSPEDALSARDGSDLLNKSVKRQRDIFLCYRRQDSAHATGRIVDRLEAEFGEDRVFKDVTSIPAGVKDFVEEIQQQLKSAKVMLAVVGHLWLTVQNNSTGKRRLDEKDDYVRIELKWGLDHKDIPVIPVLLDQTPLPDTTSLPTGLKQFAKCQAVRVRADPEFNRDVQHLIAAVKASLIRSASAAPAP